MGSERPLSDLESDIRTTAEDIQADAELLQAIEKEKAELPGGDPNILALAREAEATAKRIEAKAVFETKLAKEELARREA